MLHEDIKKPLPTVYNKSHSHWNDYVGKMFYDPGVKDDPDEPDFEAGEFEVKKVIDGNMFFCERVGTPEGYPFDISYALERIRKYEEE